MKKLRLCLVMLMVFASGLMSIGAYAFSDVLVMRWSYKAVDYVTEAGIFSGVGDNKFAPESKMTRAMLVTVLGRIADVDENSYADSAFADVSENAYYCPYVSWASDAGIAQGTQTANGEYNFSPDDSITRQDMMVLIYRYLNYANIATDSYKNSVISKYDDANDIATYAKDAMVWAVGAGVISGTHDDMLSPKGYATREQVAQLFYNARDIMGLPKTEEEQLVEDFDFETAENLIEDKTNDVISQLNSSGGASAEDSISAVYDALKEMKNDGDLRSVSINTDGNIEYKHIDGSRGMIVAPMSFAEENEVTSASYSFADESIMPAFTNAKENLSESDMTEVELATMYAPEENTSENSEIKLGDEPLMEKESLLILYNPSATMGNEWLPQLRTNYIADLEDAAKERGIKTSVWSLDIDGLKNMDKFGMVVINSPSVIAGGMLYVPDIERNYEYAADIKAGRLISTHILIPLVDTNVETTDMAIHNFSSGISNYKVGYAYGYLVDMEKFTDYYYDSNDLEETYIHLGYGNSYSQMEEIIENTGALGLSGFIADVGTEQAQQVLATIKEVIFENDSDEGNSFYDIIGATMDNECFKVVRKAYYRDLSAKVVSKTVGTFYHAQFNEELKGEDYQMWRPVNVTFDLNGGYIEGDLFAYFGGDYSMVGKTSMTVQVDKGDELDEPNEPDFDGAAKFLGWTSGYPSDDCELWDFGSDTVTEDVILTAVWEMNEPEEPEEPKEPSSDGGFTVSGSGTDPDGEYEFSFTYTARPVTIDDTTLYDMKAYYLDYTTSVTNTADYARGVRLDVDLVGIKSEYDSNTHELRGTTEFNIDPKMYFEGAFLLEGESGNVRWTSNSREWQAIEYIYGVNTDHYIINEYKYIEVTAGDKTFRFDI